MATPMFPQPAMPDMAGKMVNIDCQAHTVEPPTSPVTLSNKPWSHLKHL